MAKPSLDAGKIKNFFLLNVEKMVLALVVLLLVGLVYMGYSIEGLKESPADLEQITQTADTRMKEDTWSNLAEENRPPSGFAEVVKLGDVPTPDLPYKTDKPLKPAGRNLGEKRKDPTLFPPAKVEVYAVSGPVAFRAKTGDRDPLADAKPSELKKKEVKQETKKPRGRRGGYGSDMYSSDMYGSEDPMGGSGMPYGSDMMGEMGYGGMPSMYGAAGGATANPMKIPGFRAGPGAMYRPCNIVAVKSVVELRKQYDEYERVFSSALGYNRQRDIPRPIMFLGQRADVTDDPARELTDSDWTLVANSNSLRQQMLTDPWFGFAQEIIDPRYISPVLSMPVPPLMLRDLEPLAKHSDTPRLTATQLNMRLEAQKKMEERKKAIEEKAKTGSEAVTPGAVPGRPMSGGPMGGMMPGYGGAMGGMMPGYGAGSDMYSMGSGMESGMYSGSGMDMYGSGSDMYGSGMGMYGSGSDMYGSGMGMYGSGEMATDMYGSESGMGGYGYGAASMGPPVPTVDYALVRFHDFTAQPGRKYRYRVSVFYEDPNHPQIPAAEPNERTLDEEVKRRLAPVLQEEKEKNSRVYYVRTEWSAPSPVVEVDPNPITLAGSVDLNRPAAIPGTEQTLPAELRGRVMSVVWDPIYAVDVPGVLDASRGTVLNFTAKANVIHPITLQFRELPDFNFATGQSVIDLRGGEPLPGGDQLTSLGEYIVVDDEGNVVVRSELNDYDSFQLYTPPEATAAPAMGYGGDDMYPGEMPGPGAKRPRR